MPVQKRDAIFALDCLIELAGASESKSVSKSFGHAFLKVELQGPLPTYYWGGFRVDRAIAVAALQTFMEASR